MITTNPEISQMIDALQNIELLSLLGSVPGTLTGLTAAMLRHELEYSETQADALERSRAFIVECEVNTAAKV